MCFVKREPVPQPGFNVVTMMGNKQTVGQVGIEVEVEGNKFPKTAYHGGPAVSPEKIPEVWRYVKDGSLRGADNAEYVLAQPLPFDDVPKAVKDLFQMFSDFGSVLDDSNRTSVHVHLNVQEFHIDRLTVFMSMYYILEEILTEFCGDHRVGNLFCLRAKDAPALISHVKAFVRSNGKAGFRENVHHYAAMNTHALNKYGSLEFRALRGVTNPQPILEWVAVLRRLYELSAEYNDPRTLVEGFSSEGPLAFFSHLLGEMAGTVRQGIEMDDNAIRMSLHEGVRMAQDICYCRNWDLFQPVAFDRDPFGRDSERMMNRLSDYLNEDVAYANPGYASGSVAVIGGGYSPEPNFEPEPEYDEPENYEAFQVATVPINYE